MVEFGCLIICSCRDKNVHVILYIQFRFYQIEATTRHWRTELVYQNQWFPHSVSTYLYNPQYGMINNDLPIWMPQTYYLIILDTAPINKKPLATFCLAPRNKQTMTTLCLTSKYPNETSNTKYQPTNEHAPLCMLPSKIQMIVLRLCECGTIHPTSLCQSADCQNFCMGTWGLAPYLACDICCTCYCW